ncbi:MAG: HD domain-containing protein [Thermotogota bacterium]|nr:HD domain-containing protein [Thermotogota bacterium]
MGYEAYLVGGCVRDLFLGREPKDWDISTNATVEQMLSIFKDEGYTIVPTGIQHGTVTVVINKEMYEITSFRGENIINDLRWRDFTINALALDAENNVIDPEGGLEDIKSKIIRSANPEKAFKDDPLRMLRAVRFKAQLGFKIEDRTKNTISRLNNLLEKVSLERIRDEFNKIILSDPYVLFGLVDFDLMKFICPEFLGTIGIDQKNPNHHLDVANHIIESMVVIPAELVLRLTMFFHDIGKPQTMKIGSDGIGHFYSHNITSENIASRTLKRLKYSSKTIKTVKHLVHYHDSFPEENKKSVSRFVNKHGVEYTELLFHVWRADMKAQEPTRLQGKLNTINNVEEIFNELRESKFAITVKDLKVDGDDIIKLGIKEGPEIGGILNKLLQVVVDDPEMNKKEKLVELAKKLKKQDE